MVKSSSRGEEPSIAPLPERWYNLVLGTSFSDHEPSSKFCTLRYEFKPASIDKSQPGSLHQKKDNTVSVEFQNNQVGKPKVRFEGVCEDYKDNDAVLFFDGETFRLEKLHRAVKRLRHVRQPGEASVIAASGPSVEHCSPVRLVGGKSGNFHGTVAGVDQSLQVEVENIEFNDSESAGVKAEDQDDAGKAALDPGNMDSEEHVNIVDNDDEVEAETKKPVTLSRREIHSTIDINAPHENEEEDEIADIDISDNEPVNPSCNVADALQSQVAGERDERSSTSSSSSESGSDSSSSGSSESESGNGSRSRSCSSESSDGESSDGDSVTSI